MQKVALTIYAVPVPPANQGRVTRYTEYDISRAPKAIVMQNMRASTVIVHIRSASLCLFSLGKGGTKQAAKARLMAWASMAPLCKHLIFMYLYVRSFVHAFVHLCVPSFLHPSIHSSIHSFFHAFIHACIPPCIRSFKRLAQSLLLTWRMTPVQNMQSICKCCAGKVDAYWTQTS